MDEEGGKMKACVDRRKFLMFLYKMYPPLFLLNCFIVLYFTFLVAFFNNNSVVVYINVFGEAWVEMIMLTVSFPVVSFFVFEEVRSLCGGERKRF